MARRAAEGDAEENFVADLHRLAADVVRIFDRADEAAAVIGDVELARQVVERAIIDNDLAHLLAERHHVDQLARINARGGVRGEVADVVRARAARVQADMLDALDERGRVLWLDESHLQIRARGDLHVAGGEVLCDVRQLAELEGAELSAGDAQPRHEGFLVRREVKKPVPLEAENFLLLGRLVRGGVVEEHGVGVERMQLLFHALLEDEVFVRDRLLHCR